MSLFKRVVRMGRGQKGFTMVEVMLATFIMAFTSVGMIGMFNSSTQLSNVARERKDAQRYAQTISETITALPFYQPYDGSHDIDVDDHFWGTATERGSGITANNWPVNPVTYNPPSNIADSRYTVGVKMVYVLSDLSPAEMKSDWVPKDTTGAGLDKPSSKAAFVYHLIKFEVRVSWKSTLAEGSTTRSESYMSLMSDTQYEANLGVSAITNVDPSRPGSSGPNSNSGPHTASALMVQITGHGFVQGQTTSASLVMQGVADIPINGLTRVNDTTLTGTVNLNTGNGTAPPWQPRRDPGRYTIRVNVGLAYAYAYNAFTVEFPVPTSLSATPTSSDNSDTALAIKATGTNVLNLGRGTSPYDTAYAGATIQLVQYKDAGGNIVANPSTINAIVNDSSHLITYGNAPPGGYGVSNWVQAYFDLRNEAPGTYYVEVCNCQNNQVALKPGDVASSTTGAPLFTLTQATPTITDAYVAGSTGNEVYVGAVEKRHFAYSGRSYHYTLKVEGQCLTGIDTVELGVGGTASKNYTDADFFKVSDAGSVVVYSKTMLTANFDFNGVSDYYTRTDDSYPFWIYAYNSSTPTYNTYKTDVFQVRKPRPILYKNADYIGTGDFYHNYASIPTRLTGECLEAGSYNIYYESGNYGGSIGVQNWQVGLNDGGMLPGSPVANGTTWDTHLNLIHCLPGQENIWVAPTETSTWTDNEFTSSIHGYNSTISDPDQKYSFNVVVTTNPTLAPQANGSVTIANCFHDYWYDWGWKDAWRPGPNINTTTSNTETSSAVANAQRSNTEWFFGNRDEPGYSIFTVKIRGLVDAKAGIATTVGFYYNTSTLINSASFSGASFSTLADLDTMKNDRNTLKTDYSVTTPQWQMPNTEAWGRITVGSSNSYVNRYYIKQVLTDN